MQVSIEQDSPRVIKIQLSGRLQFDQWQAALGEVSRQLAPGEKASILIDAQGFEGWGAGKWDDLSFQMKHDEQIDRIAIVGGHQWEDRVLMFAGKGLRPVDIRFFTPEAKQQARQWVAGGP